LEGVRQFAILVAPAQNNIPRLGLNLIWENDGKLGRDRQIVAPTIEVRFENQFKARVQNRSRRTFFTPGGKKVFSCALIIRNERINLLEHASELGEQLCVEVWRYDTTPPSAPTVKPASQSFIRVKKVHARESTIAEAIRRQGTRYMIHFAMYRKRTESCVQTSVGYIPKRRECEGVVVRSNVFEKVFRMRMITRKQASKKIWGLGYTRDIDHATTAASLKARRALRRVLNAFVQPM